MQLRPHGIPARPKAGAGNGIKHHVWLFFLVLLQWKCTSTPGEVNKVQYKSGLSALAALGGLQSWVTASPGTLPAVCAEASPCPRYSRAELPLTSPGTSAVGQRAIDGPECSKCLPAFD